LHPTDIGVAISFLGIQASDFRNLDAVWVPIDNPHLIAGADFSFARERTIIGTVIGDEGQSIGN
jgi:hypothetical protein